jgi:hypothetical protein
MHIFILILLAAFICIFYWWVDNISLIPQTLISSGMMYFAYLAYLHFRESVRLKLFEKRFQIYDGLNELYGALISMPDDKVALFKIADKCTRGLGYSTHRFLFGEDVQGFLEKIDCIFVRIAVADDFINSNQFEWSEERKKLIHEKYDNLMQITELWRKAHDKFHPYLYFGDYRREANVLKKNKENSQSD